MSLTSKKIILIALLLIGAACAPIATRAAFDAGYSTGFVEHSIWYSKEKPAEGDRVSVYTALFNARAETLSGTVTFYDGTVVLGKKEFSLIGRTISTISIDWTVTAGDHAIRAEITDSTIIIDGKKQSVYFADAKTQADTFAVKKTIASVPTPPDSVPTPAAGDTSITDRIPASISAPVISAASGIDAWRVETSTMLAEKKIAAQAAINADEKSIATATLTEDDVKIAPTTNALKTPLAHVKVFFLTLATFVFEHTFVFYGLCALVLFFLLRVIWRRFF